MSGRSFSLDRASLRSEVVAVVFDLEEGDAVGLSGEGLVQYEDGGLDAGVGVEYTGRQGYDGDQVFLNEHLAELLVGVLALEDYAFGDDESGASVRVRCSAM